MKKLFCLTTMLLMITFSAQAQIVVETDNYKDTISYRTYKNVGQFGILEYSFIKHLDSEENALYFLRLMISFNNHSSTSSRYLLAKEADLIIDGQTYKIPKAVNTFIPRSFQKMDMYDMCYYTIPAEYAQALARAKSASFTIYVPNRKPDNITINENKLAEIKKIVNDAHYSNYVEDINDKK